MFTGVNSFSKENLELVRIYHMTSTNKGEGVHKDLIFFLFRILLGFIIKFE
jgi:hypothetical protein